MKRREQALTKEKLDAARDLDTMYQKKVSETEKRFSKECLAFQRKLNQVERNLINKVKLANQKHAESVSSNL